MSDKAFLSKITQLFSQFPYFLLGGAIILLPFEHPSWFFELFKKSKRFFLNNLEYFLFSMPLLFIVVYFAIIWYDLFDDLEFPLPTGKRSARKHLPKCNQKINSTQWDNMF